MEIKWSESTKARRKREKEEQFERDYEARRAEERRKAALSMWERIEEADASDDVKEILHMLAVAAGMEE